MPVPSIQNRDGQAIAVALAVLSAILCAVYIANALNKQENRADTVSTKLNATPEVGDYLAYKYGGIPRLVVSVDTIDSRLFVCYSLVTNFCSDEITSEAFARDLAKQGFRVIPKGSLDFPRAHLAWIKSKPFNSVR